MRCARPPAARKLRRVRPACPPIRNNPNITPARTARPGRGANRFPHQAGRSSQILTSASANPASCTRSGHAFGANADQHRQERGDHRSHRRDNAHPSRWPVPCRAPRCRIRRRSRQRLPSTRSHRRIGSRLSRPAQHEHQAAGVRSSHHAEDVGSLGGDAAGEVAAAPNPGCSQAEPGPVTVPSSWLEATRRPACRESRHRPWLTLSKKLRVQLLGT